MKRRRGFTLVELLIAIAIIAILAAIVFIAIDPSTRYKKARDSKRWSDSESIANAINAYLTTNEGTISNRLNSMVTGSYYMLGTGTYSNGCPNITSQTCVTQNGTVNMTSSFVVSSLGCLDISSDIQNQLPRMPVDPSGSNWSAQKTGYYIKKNSSNSYTVGACAPEVASFIAVTR